MRNPFRRSCKTARRVQRIDSQIEDLRNYRERLREQDQKALRQIDELMLERIRAAGF